MTHATPVLVGTNRATWVREVLADQEMPRDEIAAVLTSWEPRQVRHYLELHAERLEERLQERLAAQLRVLAEVERVMIDAAPLRSCVA